MINIHIIDMISLVIAPLAALKNHHTQAPLHLVAHPVAIERFCARNLEKELCPPRKTAVLYSRRTARVCL